MLAAERLENERLRKIIRELQRHRFGHRAESLPSISSISGWRRPWRKRRLRACARLAWPNAEPTGAPCWPTCRASRVVDIADDSCPCCSDPLHRISEDVSTRLDMVPSQFRVLMVRRPKYACRACTDGVVQSPAPARLIEGGLLTDATVTQVLVSKFSDHLPLHRQARILACQGVVLDRSTLTDWVGRAAALLEPVHGRLLDHFKASTKLFADETTVLVLDPGRRRTKTGQLWAYALDDRPWDGAGLPAVAYVYAPDRKAEWPMAHLAGFTGMLQVDGYESYHALTKGSAVRLAFCWSHVQCGFIDMATKGASPIAAEVLTRIAALCRIEVEIAELPAGARCQARQELKRFLGDKLALIGQKGTPAVAIRFATSRWAGLTLYADDGRVEMDSNTVERPIRSLALARTAAARNVDSGHRLPSLWDHTPSTA